MSVKELLEATIARETALYAQLGATSAFRNTLAWFDRNFDWVELAFGSVRVGAVGVVTNQNWLFQVKEVHENYLRIKIFEEVKLLYYSHGEGAVWRDPDDCLETIHKAYSEDWHYEDEDVWVLRDCLFAVYRSEA